MRKSTGGKSVKQINTNLALSFLWASVGIFVLKTPETKMLSKNLNKAKRQNTAGTSSHRAPPHFKMIQGVLCSSTFFNPKTANLLLGQNSYGVCFGLDVGINRISRGRKKNKSLNVWVKKEAKKEDKYRDTKKFVGVE